MYIHLLIRTPAVGWFARMAWRGIASINNNMICYRYITGFRHSTRVFYLSRAHRTSTRMPMIGCRSLTPE